MLAPHPHGARSAVDAAHRAFLHRFPDFDPDGTLADLRRREYGRLDAGGHVYLDYTGGGLYAVSQIDAHAARLRDRVLGNPHSHNPTSAAATASVEEARATVLRFFGAPPDEYACIFTANATGALKLVGESYPFGPRSTLALTFDNHNSVNGIREFARRRDAHVAYVPIRPGDLRIDRVAMTRELGRAERSVPNLLAFPAQSNFSGVQHRLELVADAHDAGWHVLLDASAFVSTNRLDVGRVRPDFVAASFYKIFGFPTGSGCLVVRREHLGLLRRPWFSGGTVTVASVQGDGHYLRPDEGAFEDGTVDYLDLAAVTDGIRWVEHVDRDAIHTRVACLTEWLLDELTSLRHGNGRAVVQIHGPTEMVDRGATVSFLVRDRDGAVVDERVVEDLAGAEGISLRTGCFCNPGAGEVAHGLGSDEIAPWFGHDRAVWPDDLRRGLSDRHGREVAAVRVSFGIASTFADAHRMVRFLHRFVDRPRTEPVSAGGHPS